MLRERVADESGVTMVIVAMFLPVALALALFVIDTANVFVHKRHLQVQADAGALAAAQDIGVIGSCNDATVAGSLKKYAGLDGSTTNQQVGGTSATNVLWALNSASYPRGGSTDTTVDTRTPCAGTMIDLKLTETDLPQFIGLGITDNINAHARVSFFKAKGSDQLTPFSALDFQASNVEAEFVNEDTGAELGTWFPLGASTDVALGTNHYNTASHSLAIGTGVRNVGLRVRITVSGTTTTYDTQASPVRGLTHIRGYSTTGTGTVVAPIVRDVTLDGSAGCSNSDAYFQAATCPTSMSANIDMGAAAGWTCSTVESTMGTAVTVFVNGGNKSAASLTCQSVTGSVVHFSSPTFSAAPAAGANTLTLHYAVTKKTVPTCQSQCTKVAEMALESGNAVQQAFLASTGRSGPILDAQITRTDTAPATGLANSFPQGAAYPVVVSVTLPSGLDAVLAGGTSKLVSLRKLGGNQTQLVDCAPVSGPSNSANTVATGCKGDYQVNTKGCPDASTPPITCISPKTGTVQSLSKGLNDRIYGSSNGGMITCPTAGQPGWNNWGGTIPSGDPRVVEVFIADYGEFQANGSSSTIPIRRFASFYVTGWDGNGNGNNNPCSGNDATTLTGDVVGHFIKYVSPHNTGDGDSGTCVLTTIDLCFAALTE